MVIVMMMVIMSIKFTDCVLLFHHESKAIVIVMMMVIMSIKFSDCVLLFHHESKAIF